MGATSSMLSHIYFFTLASAYEQCQCVNHKASEQHYGSMMMIVVMDSMKPKTDKYLIRRS